MPTVGVVDHPLRRLHRAELRGRGDLVPLRDRRVDHLDRHHPGLLGDRRCSPGAFDWAQPLRHRARPRARPSSCRSACCRSCSRCRSRCGSSSASRSCRSPPRSRTTRRRTSRGRASGASITLIVTGLLVLFLNPAVDRRRGDRRRRRAAARRLPRDPVRDELAAVLVAVRAGRSARLAAGHHVRLRTQHVLAVARRLLPEVPLAHRQAPDAVGRAARRRRDRLHRARRARPHRQG